MAMGRETSQGRHFRRRDRVPMQGLSWSREVAWKACCARASAARGTQIQTGLRILPCWHLFPAESWERSAVVVDAGEIGIGFSQRAPIRAGLRQEGMALLLVLAWMRYRGRVDATCETS